MHCIVVFFAFMIATSDMKALQLASGVNTDTVFQVKPLKLIMQRPCLTDEDCRDFNQYCYKGLNCASCQNCTVYHRSPGEQPCVKDPKNCGPCLSGFSPKILTNNEVSLSCQYHDLQDSSLSTAKIITIAVLAAIVVVVVVFLAYLGYKWIRRRVAGPTNESPRSVSNMLYQKMSKTFRLPGNQNSSDERTGPSVSFKANGADSPNDQLLVESHETSNGADSPNSQLLAESRETSNGADSRNDQFLVESGKTSNAAVTRKEGYVTSSPNRVPGDSGGQSAFSGRSPQLVYVSINNEQKMGSNSSGNCFSSSQTTHTTDDSVKYHSEGK